MGNGQPSGTKTAKYPTKTVPSSKKSSTSASPIMPSTSLAVQAQFGMTQDYTIRGVNLGSWFVLESWMVPSIFDAPDLKDLDIPDEWTYSKVLGKSEESYLRMMDHYETWITEADFEEMASYGLNTIRLPVGYWAFIDEKDNDEPYFTGIQLPYISKALQWACANNMDVIVDLHGLPGSQNGFDNSGKAGSINFPKSQKNADIAIGALVKIVELYVNDPSYNGVVKSIEVVNEPLLGDRFPRSFLDQFYRDSYFAMTEAVDLDTAVVVPTFLFSDGFIGLDKWDTFFDDDFWEEGSYMLDVHKYQAFEPENRFTMEEHIEYACNFTDKLRAASDLHPVVVGEFFLNIGGNSSAPVVKKEKKTMLDDIYLHNTDEQNLFYRRYWEAQTGVFEDQSSGWIYWAWKTENAAMGSYQAGVKQGWIPEDPDERVFQPKPYSTTCVSKEPDRPLEFATRRPNATKAKPFGKPHKIADAYTYFQKR